MAKRKYRPEEIVIKLRQVEVLQSQGIAASDAIRQIGVSEVTYYRWCKEYRGMDICQLNLLTEVEKENQQLRKAVSNLTLDKLILKETISGKY
jgi:transposase